ncbi:hypothetical protein [Streptomyces sp. CAU 1734]|uniref:hypothetical protein n=1 Tax=Streptomyces sp. CAU 1734 TaxID=3140360 RepID=UPI003261245B
MSLFRKALIAVASCVAVIVVAALIHPVLALVLLILIPLVGYWIWNLSDGLREAEPGAPRRRDPRDGVSRRGPTPH